jgi:hypothetical protein
VKKGEKKKSCLPNSNEVVLAMLKTRVRTCRRYNTILVQETCPVRCVISKLETDIDQHAHTEAMARRFCKVLYIEKGSLTRKGRLTTFLRLHQRRGDIPMWSPKPHSYTWILSWALLTLAYPANAHIHIHSHSMAELQFSQSDHTALCTPQQRLFQLVWRFSLKKNMDTEGHPHL